jgi:hypothetical protein
LDGPIAANAGTAVFTGAGKPGTLIYVLRNGVAYGTTTVVGAGGSYSLSVAGAGIAVGDQLVAAAGSPTGPASAAVTAIAAPASPPSGVGASDGGATELPVQGSPGTVVNLVDTTTQAIVGTATIGSGGTAVIDINPPLTAADSYVLSGDGIQGAGVSVGPAGTPPQVTNGATLVEGSSISGTGTPGDTITVVDGTGKVLGTAVVAANGTFVVPINGATAGQNVYVLQNGVKAPIVLKSGTLGAETAFTTSNVFKPLQGGVLGIGFKAENDDHITVKIFNLAGQLVQPVLELDCKAGLIYNCNWDGRNEKGDTVSSGIYFISVRGHHQHSLKKVILLK